MDIVCAYGFGAVIASKWTVITIVWLMVAG